MQELTAKRKYNSKQFDIPAGTTIKAWDEQTQSYKQIVTAFDGQYKKMSAHVGHIHYKDDQGDFQDSNFDLEDMGAYWEMTKHNYHLRIAKDFSAPVLMQYKNKFEGANHTITYEPKMLAWVNSPDLSDMQVFRQQQAVQGVLDNVNHVIRYTDAFGAGIHFEITLLRSGFKKEIVIDAKNNLENPPTGQHHLVALFEYGGSGLRILKRNKEMWDKDGYFEAEDGFEIEEEGNTVAKSFIRPAYIIDEGMDVHNPEATQLLKVFWKKHNNKLYQAKVLSKNFLKNAVYPVRADTVTDYYTGAGDGYVLNTNNPNTATWSTLRDGTAYTKQVNYTSTTLIRVGDRNFNTSGVNTIWRAFNPADTSGLTSGATITAASFFGYGIRKDDHDNDGDDFITPMVTSQASTSSLSTSDYTAYTNTSIGDQVDLTSINTAGYQEFAISSPDSNISKTGFTKIGLIEGHDLNNNQPSLPANDDGCFWDYYPSEDTNGSRDPYYEVTYTVASSQNSAFLAFM